MKKINELRDYLLENYIDDYGALNISGLDFSEFDGDVDISFMKVKGDLFLESQEVEGSLFLESRRVQGDYHCKNVQVKGSIFTAEPTRLLKPITIEELEKMGYKIKEEKENEI